MKKLNNLEILFFLTSSINGDFSKFNKSNFWRIFKIVSYSTAQNYSSYIPAYKLKNDLFTVPGYDSWIRPVVNIRTVTNISLSLSLMQIIKIVRKSFVFLFQKFDLKLNSLLKKRMIHKKQFYSVAGLSW